MLHLFPLLLFPHLSVIPSSFWMSTFSSHIYCLLMYQEDTRWELLEDVRIPGCCCLSSGRIPSGSSWWIINWSSWSIIGGTWRKVLYIAFILQFCASLILHKLFHYWTETTRVPTCFDLRQHLVTLANIFYSFHACAYGRNGHTLVTHSNFFLPVAFAIHAHHSFPPLFPQCFASAPVKFTSMAGSCTRKIGRGRGLALWIWRKSGNRVKCRSNRTLGSDMFLSSVEYVIILPS